MKKTYLLTTLSIFIFCAGASAQMKSYLGFYGGMSVPRGDFANSTYENNKSGFANRGMTFSVDGGIYVYKNLAIGINMSFQDQGELTASDTYTLAQGYTNSFKADQATVTAVGRYHTFDILVGPQYSFTYHKFILDLRANAGFIKILSTPTITTKMTGVPQQTGEIVQKGGGGILLGYGGNAALRYKFADNWAVVLRGNYIIDKGPTVTTTGRTENVGRLVTRVPMNVFQTTIGLTIDL